MENLNNAEYGDVNLKWKKTKLVKLASCREASMDDQFEQKDESASQKSDLEQDNAGYMNLSSELNETNNEDDDVFICDQPRRASEPVVLKPHWNSYIYRSSRHKPNKLRSLSEDVSISENRLQSMKLTRSVSDAQTTLSQFRSFSPKIVKKIDLSASLHDWLENEKQFKNQKSKIPVNRGSNEKPLSHVESNIEENYSYGRQHANETRRPSAPAALSAKNENNTRKNMKSPHTLSCHNNSVNAFDSNDELQIYTLIKDLLKSKLESVDFCALSCRQWCEEISEIIKESIQKVVNTQCKVVCTIYIGALRDDGIHTASQAALDCKLDYHVSAAYQNDSLFAAVSALVVQYGNK